MKILTLKFAGKCADCGTALAVGETAKWYGKGRVFGLNCHDRDGNRLNSGDDSQSHKRKYGRCEDAPCCGCCGGVESYIGDYYGTGF